MRDALVMDRDVLAPTVAGLVFGVGAAASSLGLWRLRDTLVMDRDVLARTEGRWAPMFLRAAFGVRVGVGCAVALRFLALAEGGSVGGEMEEAGKSRAGEGTVEPGTAGLKRPRRAKLSHFRGVGMSSAMGVMAFPVVPGCRSSSSLKRSKTGMSSPSGLA